MVLQQILSEHHDLRGFFDRLRAVASAPDRALPEVRWRHLLGGELSAVSQALQEHFALEERDGYMADVLSVRPAFSRQVDSLASQHVEILKGVGALQEGVAKNENVPALKEGVLQLLGTLEAHEHAENELIQSAITDDIGVGD